MATLTKKMVSTLSQEVMDTIVTHTNPQPRLYMNLLSTMMQDKAVNARQFAINHAKVYLETHGQRLAPGMEASGWMDPLEKTIRKGLSDNNPGVREASRSTFWIFDGIWRERGAAMVATLDSMTKKQLEKSCPVPGKVSVPTTPATKRSTVAAAIAASRAKAKALATMPPALKQQALAPQVQKTPSPPQVARAATSPKEGVYTIRRQSNSRPMSPLSPPARKPASFSPSSSYSGFASTPVHIRARSAEAPPSPNTHRRFASSQISPPTSPRVSDTLRKASQTALPASPRASLDQAFTVPASPSRKDRSRAASPTRIPSPTRFDSGRTKEVRSSLFALTSNALQPPPALVLPLPQYINERCRLLIHWAILESRSLSHDKRLLRHRC